MAKGTKTAWIEAEFEKWFSFTHTLPGGEQLLLVSRHKPLGRMVDLICLDQGGGLVILEVKNEASNRTAIGQALEYLSHYDDLALEDLVEDYEEEAPDTLRDAFVRVFRSEPVPLTGRRRVFLIAPSHDAYSAVCTRYLSGHLSNGEVTFHLLKATKAGEEFRLEEFECPPFKRASMLGPSFALTPRGRLFYVLQPGLVPVAWSVGRWRESDSTLEFRAKPSRRAVKVLKGHLLPTAPPEQVDLSESGTVWTHISKAGRSATVVGSVELGTRGETRKGYVVFADFKNDRFGTFRKRPAAEFHSQWKRSDRPPVDWTTIVRLAQAKIDAKKAALLTAAVLPEPPTVT